MTSLKPLQWAAILLGLSVAGYFAYSRMYMFSNISFLAGILLLEIFIATVWKYDQRFFILLIIAFAWAGMGVPLGSAWVNGRWAVLAVGAVAGSIVWIRSPRGRFGAFHLIAFFCVCAAFVSATVSSFSQMALLKSSSLLLLFTYCATGARLAFLGREERFFPALLLGSEIVVYGTAICYLGLGQQIWGNPNSLGAVMSVALFPVLLWGWFTSDGQAVRFRRLMALLLCTYLAFFSMARAAMVSITVVTVVCCYCLRQYKLLMKVAATVLLLIAVTGTLAPDALSRRFGELKDAVLYKGHKEEGLMGSRRTPWEKSIASIKEHPWFGTGYGTSATGEDPGSSSVQFASSAEAASREHGSSYMSIAEWVGVLGVLPFVALLAITVSNLRKVLVWMRQTAEPRHYSIPVAMVVLAGLVDASFEDWLFAVGYYLCVFVWVFAFVLADLVPDAALVPVTGSAVRASRPSPADFGTILPTR
jgi:O-antigen ligase